MNKPSGHPHKETVLVAEGYATAASMHASTGHPVVCTRGTERQKPRITIDGLKRNAKRIKKAEGIQHARALDKAAQEAGFSNFAHARRLLALKSNTYPLAPTDED